jgi:hypothetical protein
MIVPVRKITYNESLATIEERSM